MVKGLIPESPYTGSFTAPACTGNQSLENQLLAKQGTCWSAAAIENFEVMSPTVDFHE